MHIAVAGNIGSGKTTLTTLLAKHYNWKAHFEDADTNPYLNDFYDDMQRWSFNLQIYFLNSRFAQVQDIRKSGMSVIQDRTIYEDAHIFAPNLHTMGLMTARDFENYFSLFQLIPDAEFFTKEIRMIITTMLKAVMILLVQLMNLQKMKYRLENIIHHTPLSMISSAQLSKSVSIGSISTWMEKRLSHSGHIFIRLIHLRSMQKVLIFIK